MQYYIGSVKFIGLEISSNIGYRNIGKMSYRCNTTTHRLYVPYYTVKMKSNHNSQGVPSVGRI